MNHYLQTGEYYMQLKRYHLQDSGIQLLETKHKYTKLLVIPSDWVTAIRVDSKMSLTVGDIIQETLRMVHNYDSMNSWETHASRARVKASVKYNHKDQIVSYNYQLPIVKGVEMLGSF